MKIEEWGAFNLEEIQLLMSYCYGLKSIFFLLIFDKFAIQCIVYTANLNISIQVPLWAPLKLFCAIIAIALIKEVPIPPGARADRLERNIISKEEAQSYIKSAKQFPQESLFNRIDDEPTENDYDTGARIYAMDSKISKNYDVILYF